MSVAQGKEQEWVRRGERGAVWAIRFISWFALRVGRPAALLLLYPICAYFLVFTYRSRRASRQYLSRVLKRAPGLIDVFRHYYTFAVCLLDRVYLLNSRFELFDIRVFGEPTVETAMRQGSGCLLIGAHFGSFEAARALGRQRPGLRVGLVMYEENARKIREVLQAINPDLALEVIGLRTLDSMIALRARLERGQFIGMLADRVIADEEVVYRPFLGTPAAFPVGAFRVAALLGCPVVLMFGIYRGGSRYDVHFEPLLDGARSPGERNEEVARAMRLYVERLEHHCRTAPFNWFNYHDFWQ